MPCEKIGYKMQMFCNEEMRCDFLEDDKSVLKRVSRRKDLVNQKHRSSAIVREGSKITLRFDDGIEKVVVIGKDVKADSPLALAILGKHEGEEVNYTENGVTYHVKILKVEACKWLFKKNR